MPVQRKKPLTDRRGRRLTKFEASDIRRQSGLLWKKVRQYDAVAICCDGEAVAVMLSPVGFLDLLFGRPKRQPKKAGRGCR